MTGYEKPLLVGFDTKELHDKFLEWLMSDGMTIFTQQYQKRCCRARYRRSAVLYHTW